MCFSPKISTPKPSTAAPEPAPLSEEVASVDIGAEADADTKETKGISDLKVKKDSAPKDKSSVSRAMRASGVNMG
ncbi:hypothetical protein HOV18_gp38 [Cronobacter phage GW1]|uniref:Uncharacterized protein n=1 Tax=Cronobacter phage GW1 TaxID=2200756 RepID=A0A3S7N8Q8_9CAUD|nr:hypothetical protein HOV18_gp38 [Cronobacter phage GW1]AWY03151.1 hypothetical protein GW1_00038 [Cronobacter phage GW1]